MWSAEGGGSVHGKNGLVSSRQHRATEVQKLRFLSSCQYTHGCYAPASWAARHTTMCLDMVHEYTSSQQNYKSLYKIMNTLQLFSAHHVIIGYC